MLYAYQLNQNKLERIDEKESLQNANWIDLIEPSSEERKLVAMEFNQDLATHLELEDIETSARFFEDEDGLHIHSFFFYSDLESRANNETVAFTIHNNRLFTLREREVPAFRLYRMRSRYNSLDENNAYDILLELFDIKVEQLADKIEWLYSDLEKIGLTIMKNASQECYDEAISKLGEIEDTAWKIRLCLMDSQRAINFLIRRSKIENEQLDNAKEVIRDIESLTSHNESLFQKINFLIQAAMGFINIEQSRIIKIFSVVSVVFLPPTLVASIYGMNFTSMPELSWRYGYLFSILLMIAVALAPYFYFKFKKWL